MSHMYGVKEHEVHEHAHCHHKHFSWTAVIVGAFVGIGLSFLLNLFSIAINLSLVSTTKEGMVTLAVGGFIGILIGAIVAMFVAGFTAGYLGRPYTVKNLGPLYGFTAWCLALILTALLTSHMGRYVTAYSNFASNPSEIIVTDNNSPAGMMPMNMVNPNNGMPVMNAQKSINSLGMGTFLIFILFFIGALASCFGGHYGMACREKHCLKDDDIKRTV